MRPYCQQDAGEYKQCEACRARQRSYYAKDPGKYISWSRGCKEFLVESGLCRQCGVCEPAVGITLCPGCRDKNAAQRRGRRDALKAEVQAGKRCSACLRAGNMQRGRRRCVSCTEDTRRFRSSAKKHTDAKDLIVAALLVTWPMSLEELAMNTGLSTRTILRVVKDVPGLVSREVDEFNAVKKIYMLREVAV